MNKDFWRCCNCESIVTLDTHGRCSHCNSDAVVRRLAEHLVLLTRLWPEENLQGDFLDEVQDNYMLLRL